ncbi:MAG: flagellar hook-length control protein FliK [Alphaproteobacteria bacterium]|nr:flagellar hook-length control protein FliK [Alphaproteobacteria bacterium]
MDTHSSLEALNRSGNLAANLLASLGAAIESDPEGAKLFTDLLSRGGKFNNAPKKTSLPGAGDDLSVFSSNKIPPTLANFLERLKAQSLRQVGTTHCSADKNAKSPPAADAAAAKPPNVQTSSEMVVTPSQENAVDTADIVTCTGTAEASACERHDEIDLASLPEIDQKTLLDVLAELKTILKWIVQALQDARAAGRPEVPVEAVDANSAAAEADFNPLILRDLRQFTLFCRYAKDEDIEKKLADLLAKAGDAKPTGDVASTEVKDDQAGDALAAIFMGLVILTRLVEQRLDLVSADGMSLTPDADIPVDSNAQPILADALLPEDQIKLDLKNFVAILRTFGLAIGAAAQKSSDVVDTAKPDMTPVVEGDALETVSDRTVLLEAAVESALETDSMPETVPDMQKLQDSFWGLFNNTINHLFGRAAPAAVVAALRGEAMAPLGGHGGAMLDMGLQADGKGWAQGASLNTSTNQAPWLAVMDGTTSIGPYNFASQLSAARALNGGLTGLPSPVEQVILRLNRSARNGDDQMTIQLRPAELGRIHIKLTIAQDGRVQGMVVADNPSTLDLLLKDVRSLERALQEAGLRADSGSLQFSLSGQSGNSSGQMADETGNGKPSAEATPVAEATHDAPETWYLTPGRVNMKV